MELRRLMGRVSEYYQLATNDVQSARLAEAMIVTLATERDRERIASITSEQAAFNASVERLRRSSDLTYFGGFGAGMLDSAFSQRSP